VAVQRTVLRLGAVLAGLTALGVALPTLASSQQKPSRQRSGEPQKCCDVRLRDAGGTVLAGGRTASVTAAVAADGNGCTDVHPRITVRLAGLDPDEIRIERVVRGTPVSLPVRPARAGVVHAADPPRDGVRLCGGDRASLVYRLTFLPGAPAGRAIVSAEAGKGGGKQLGQDDAVTVVQGLTPVPPPSAPRTSAPAGRGAGPADPAAPESDADSPSATEPAAARPGATAGPLSAALVATGLGAVVAATVALVGVLALRQRRRGKDRVTGPTDSAGPDRRPGPLGRQPTLHVRWSSLVGAMRRPPGTVSKES
jgi:hypothetical protein